MSDALDHLIALLSLEQMDDHTYRGLGSANDGFEGIYGGHYLGQSTAAACASVPRDRRIHSLHAYFVKSGKPGLALDYEVTAVRDGGSFNTRRVSATQEGGPVLFELMASFCKDEDSPHRLDPNPPADFETLPDPDSLPTYRELMESHEPLVFPADWALRDMAVDIRTVNAPWAPAGPSTDGGIRTWIRTVGRLPDDPGLHAAALAYNSDDSISDNALVPFDVTWGTPNTMIVSLDHAMWFHRPFRFDEWLFVEQWPVSVANARGLASATVWNRDGQLVSTFTQEALGRF